MAQSMSQFAAGFDYEAHQRRMKQIGQTANTEVAERRTQAAVIEKKAKPKRTKKLVISEDEHQAAVIKWRDDQVMLGRMPGINLLFAIPNGGKRILGEARKLRRTGTTAGVCDLFLPIARKQKDGSIAHGLFVEMKSTVGKVSPAQRQFIDDVQAQGYAVHVCYSATEAIDKIERYYRGDAV
jgi:hypothetical protein